jgi:hypothetical protein
MQQPMKLDYSDFVCSGSLATTIANREQQQLTAMPKRYTLHAMRTMAHLHETSVIEISYPDLNITSMIVRVVTIDRGSLTEGEIILETVEDVFGTVYTVFATPPAAGESTASETITEGDQDQLVVDRLTGEAVWDRKGLDWVYDRANNVL